jgi:hypothetical protein
MTGFMVIQEIVRSILHILALWVHSGGKTCADQRDDVINVGSRRRRPLAAQRGAVHSSTTGIARSEGDSSGQRSKGDGMVHEVRCIM